VTTCLGQR